MTTLRSSVFGWKSVWMDLADEMKGEFTDGPNGIICRIPMKGTPLSLTIKMHEAGMAPSSKKQTVLALPYVAQGDFSFALHNKTWFEEAAKPFGLQDIIIGDEAFDAEYIIQGSDAALVRELLSEPSLRELIQGQPKVRLSIYKDKGQLSRFGSVPVGVHVLTYTEEDAINSFERLSGLGDLMKAVLDGLFRIGVAQKVNPNFVI